MRALVTGGAGFIGSHLCRRLVKDGHYVVAVDNLSTGVTRNLEELEGNSHFSFYGFDVNDKEQLKNVFKKNTFDIVLHLAANADVAKGEENPQEDITNTLQTTLTVLDTMRLYGVNKFFLASSSTVYGKVSGRIQENTSVMRPISHYGAAKLASEAFVSSFCNLHGFQVWIARFCNTVGPNMTHGVIPDLIRKLKQHPDRLEVYGDGNQSKPYIYIDDLIEGVISILNNSNNEYNDFLIGVDTNMTVREIAELVMEEMCVHIPIDYEVDYTGWKGDVTQYAYDISRIKLLGWVPTYSSFEAVRLAIRQNK